MNIYSTYIHTSNIFGSYYNENNYNYWTALILVHFVCIGISKAKIIQKIVPNRMNNHLFPKTLAGILCHNDHTTVAESTIIIGELASAL